MKGTVSDNTVRDNCYRILDTIYENIIEFNRGEQTMCIRKLEEIFESPFAVGVKITSDNAAQYFAHTFIAGDDVPEILGLLERANSGPELYSAVCFRFKTQGGVCVPCEGRIFCNEYSCWLCFRARQVGQTEEPLSDNRVVVHTSGYFELFVNDAAVLFRTKKAKELLALLVERKGGFLSSGEAVKLLWQNEAVNETTLSRYRKVAMRMHQTLAENGIEDIVENRDGNRRIVPGKIRYDRYM